MTIMQKGHRFRAGNSSSPTSRANHFCNRGCREVLPTTDFVSFLYDIQLGIFERALRVNSRTELTVGEQTIPIRIASCCDCSAINVSGGRINGMMMAEHHAFTKKLPQYWSISLRHEIGTHSIPDDHKNVTILLRLDGLR